MSTPRRFLIVDSPAHGEIVDQLLCQYVRDRDNNKGSRWAGVSVRVNPDDTETYGILWQWPANELYGDPPTDPALVLVEEVLDENGDSDWQDLPEPEPEDEEEL